jgi:hypothetical protein
VIARNRNEVRMRDQGRRARVALALAGALALMVSHSQAADETRYPDLKGEWMRLGSGSFDPGKPAGRGQQAPLTPEYQAVLEASLVEQAAGGQGNNPMGECIPPGMPRTMINYEGMELLVTPETTYIMLLEPMNQLRRIYTDGRVWPAQITPSYLGYSIGSWVDEDHDGRLDTLLVETRAIKGPRSYDSSGMPFHRDGQTVIKERIYVDPANRDIVRNEITTIDHALTRPWTVTRTYRRARHAIWFEYPCAEHNEHVFIGKENYYLSADGDLMPARKNQPPPDLRYFDRPGN